MGIKERIIQEASALFFKNGIRSITMSDIANHLGISKRTLYENFNDKEELLEACLLISMEKANKETEELLKDSENVIDALMRIYAKNLNDMHNLNKSVIHDFKKYHPKLYQLIDCKQKDDIDIFLPLFEKGAQQGLIRNDLNFEVLLWLLKAQFKMLLEGDFMPTNKYNITEFAEAIILNFTRGIATPKGQLEIDEISEKIKQSR